MFLGFNTLKIQTHNANILLYIKKNKNIQIIQNYSRKKGPKKNLIKGRKYLGCVFN